MDAILRTDQRKVHTAPFPALADTLPQATTEQPVVLIVDDEPDVRIILSRFLRDQFPAYEIIALDNPIDVLPHIASRRVHLVITDFNMPGQHGLQLTAQIKTCSPRTQVLLITAYTTAILECLARQHRVDYYMTKPFRLTAMERLIGHALAAA